MSDRPTEPAAASPWNEQFATDLVGKTLLIGVTYLDAGGSPVEQVQFHGIVVEADRGRGITIICQGEQVGRRFTLPPHLEAIEPAKPGEYRLRSTGEIVLDPDFTTSGTVQRPAS
jgi:hypothetical protein